MHRLMAVMAMVMAQFRIRCMAAVGGGIVAAGTEEVLGGMAALDIISRPGNSVLALSLKAG